MALSLAQTRVCANAIGLTVQPLERGPDWHRASAWWGMKTKVTITTYDGKRWPIKEPVPLWSHLGGGTHSDVTRLSWWQRQRRRRAIRQRRRWIAAVKQVLAHD